VEDPITVTKGGRHGGAPPFGKKPSVGVSPRSNDRTLLKTM